MNYEGSAEKFSYRIFFSNFYFGTVGYRQHLDDLCPWLDYIWQVKYPGVGGVSNMSDT